MMRTFHCLIVSWLLLGTLGTLPAAGEDKPEEKKRPPNIVIIFADDMGYGDLGCYGHPTIKTPHLDQMASEGLRFTQFYVAECVCSPSRAGLMTGRLPIRTGMYGDKWRVLRGNGTGGMAESEITIADSLKTKDYATACVGKWHLGHLPQFLPMRQGFDSYYGIPYSNDMQPSVLMRNGRVIEEPVQQASLTSRYTAEAVNFIRENRDRPFFLYMPHNFPHTPLFASDEFKDKSRRGLYGDVINELDASVGSVLQTIRDLELSENTFVFFTSDNGPWLIRNQDGGSAGLLREGKGSTWEGGMREPAIAWWPGTIPPGRVTEELGCTTDLLATVHGLLEIPLPSDRPMDSLDLRPVLLGTGESPRKSVLYYRGSKLMAARLGPWKAHFLTQEAYGQAQPDAHDPPLLYQLEHDPSEKYDVSKDHPEVMAEIRKLVDEHQANLVVPPSQFDIFAN